MIISVLDKAFNLFNRIVVSPLKKVELKSVGHNVLIGRRTHMTWKNVSLGNNVYIGPDCEFISANAKIIIGNNVLFGPKVTIITGDHRFDVIGKSIIDVVEKRPEDDLDVVFEGDNWCGANSIILKGVKVGYGAIIASGSVVTKDVPEYSIVGGVPSRVISRRFNDLQQQEHERIIKRQI